MFFLFAKKTLVFKPDGYKQHLKALIYYSDYLKKIINNIFIKHKFVIPQFDFSIGEGSDIIQTLCYYVLGDPFCIVSIFFDRDNMYICYQLLCIIRVYFAGIAFSELCFYNGYLNIKKNLTGTICYIFCTWTFMNIARHPYFLNPMIYFPIIIIGVNKIINFDKPYLYISSIFIACSSNFYFFYEIVILTIIYVFVKIVLKEKNLKKILFILIRIFIYSLIGVLLASFIIFPVIYFIFSDGRLNSSFAWKLIYPLEYYKKIPSMFFTTYHNKWLCMGFSAPTIISTISAFINRKKHKDSYVFIVLSIICFMIPFFGQAFNCFSYISNKWSFVLSLLNAYVYIQENDEVNNIYIYIFIMSLILIYTFIFDNSNLCLFFQIFICFIYLAIKYFTKKNTHKELIVMITFFISISINIYFFYSPYETNYTKNTISVNDAKKIINDNEANFVKKNIDDKEFFRYSSNPVTENSSMLNNVYSINRYFSLSNKNINDLNNDIDNNEVYEYLNQNNDKRTIINEIKNVKYFITKHNSNEFIPYGYKLTNGSNAVYDLYENELYLPFGYTYTNSISYNKWIEFNSVEREEILLQAIVLENNEKNFFPELESEELKYSIDYNKKNIILNDNMINVNRNNSKLIFNFNKKNNSEIYIYIKGLKFNGNKDKCKIDIIQNGNKINSIDYRTENDSHYYNKHDYIINLGFNIEQTSGFELMLNEKGIYSFDYIKIFSKTFNNYKKNINLLKKDHLYNISILDNRIEGFINSTKNEYLLLTVPYSDGWKAYVDEKEVELLKANVAYSAIHLKDVGEHHITLKYETPYLRLGIITSFVTAILFVLYLKLSKTK